MESIIMEPWPWYVAGPIIAVVYALLALFGKSFGVSATLRAACAMAGAGKKVKFFDFDWHSQKWNLMFVFGGFLGGFIAHQFMTPETYTMDLAESTRASLDQLNLTSYAEGMIPWEIFNWDTVFTWRGLFIFVGSGLFIGFGTRWAGGCTSGHAISGLANLQLPSLIAVIGFFIGGMFVTFFVVPYVYQF